MIVKHALLPALALVALGAHAQEDDFVFAPAYMLADGKSAVSVSVEQARTSQEFVNFYGTNTLDGYETSESLDYRYGLTARDSVSVAVSNTSSSKTIIRYGNGAEVDIEHDRKVDPAVGYEHLFSSRDSAFKIAGFVSAGKYNEKPVATFITTGLNLQYRSSKELLLFGGVSYHNAGIESRPNYGAASLGLEWRAAPMLTLAAEVAGFQIEATRQVPDYTSSKAGVFAHVEFMPGSYFSLGFDKTYIGEIRQQNVLIKSSNMGYESSAGLYFGF
jgi:hypothetical protein